MMIEGCEPETGKKSPLTGHPRPPAERGPQSARNPILGEKDFVVVAYSIARARVIQTEFRLRLLAELRKKPFRVPDDPIETVDWACSSARCLRARTRSGAEPRAAPRLR